MNGFTKLIQNMREFGVLCDAILENTSPILADNLSVSSQRHIAHALINQLGLSCLFVAQNESDAKEIFSDMRFFDKKDLFLFAKREEAFFDAYAASEETEHQRANTLFRLLNAKKPVVIASAQSLMQNTQTFADFKDSIISLKEAMTINLDETINKLIESGYQRTDEVSSVGQFSVRGGILDIFSPNNESPVRVELWGDEIDSIREFSPLDQISQKRIQEAVICPCKEFNLNSSASILDYMPKDTVVFMAEPQKIFEMANAFLWEIEESYKNLLEEGNAPKNLGVKTFGELSLRLSKQRIVLFSALLTTHGEFKPKKTVSFTVKTLHSFHGRMEFFYEDIKAWHKDNYKIIILSASTKQAERLKDELYENLEIAAGIQKELSDIDYGETVILTGSLYKGFEYPLLRCAVISDREFFHQKKQKRKKKDESLTKIKSAYDINVGDFVVHDVHGIGVYEGICKLNTLGVTKDYFKIKYQGADCLYVPTTSLDLINKYIGSEGVRLKVNKLGGADFSKTKAKVKKYAYDLAEKLIKIYAERKALPGFSFSKDSEWQRQFEDSFEYEETDDQIIAIEELKKDMQAPHPMDRLLCGDVGFGKTEVAIRGAFKAVLDSKQVAYLVPTTILASQQYNNFVARMKDFPVKIELLCRFSTKKQQAEILKKLKSGEVDIVIGTHRLLSDDVSFKDLGFLIIDEEQRFGVRHKEKLRELKAGIDVLTMTATPIPRTLHMSMIGIRDMSTLSMPPHDRQPVQTYVLEHNKSVIISAIEKELSRGGQVFYLYNRVDGIYRVRDEIKASLPDANVLVAHGQMSETELEKVMLSVINGEVDVLVCTTIIETGLDISNMNTIIISDADRFGLSQLYQLRGRVGRSNKRAYAYLTFKKDKALSEEAMKRLQAIKEFTQFGSGFKLALRDLEIRGAGNVLGPEQHGFLATVGYDMYLKLLNEAVDELSGKTVTQKIETHIDLPVNAFIDEEIITNDQTRIELYKKISTIESQEDLYDVYAEIEDRFQIVPPETARLLEIALIKSLAQNRGIYEISYQNEKLILKLSQMCDMQAISALTLEFKGKILFNAGHKPYISYKYKMTSEDGLLENIKNLLQFYNPL